MFRAVLDNGEEQSAAAANLLACPEPPLRRLQPDMFILAPLTVNNEPAYGPGIVTKQLADGGVEACVFGG